MRILVTNDDGVHAPGLAVLTAALARWAGAAHEVVVVAPLANHSGASAAVGTVYERESIAYRVAEVAGAEAVPAYGLDASPALAVIVGALGGFGPRPDLVVSGINHGVNVGRSILHSGTVGACLTGAQLGVSGLAVSLRSDRPVDHYETAAELAVALVPVLAAARAGTVLNLNVPSVPPGTLRGVRHGAVGRAGIIKTARAERLPAAAQGDEPEEGEVALTLGTAVPALAEGWEAEETPGNDTEVVGAGFASLTALRGVAEDTDPAAREVLAAALAALRPPGRG